MAKEEIVEDDECECGECEDSEEEFSVEDVAYEAFNKVDALIQILVRKGLIKEQEIDAQIEKMIQEVDEE